MQGTVQVLQHLKAIFSPMLIITYCFCYCWDILVTFHYIITVTSSEPILVQTEMTPSSPDTTFGECYVLNVLEVLQMNVGDVGNVEYCAPLFSLFPPPSSLLSLFPPPFPEDPEDVLAVWAKTLPLVRIGIITGVLLVTALIFFPLLALNKIPSQTHIRKRGQTQGLGQGHSIMALEG